MILVDDTLELDDIIEACERHYGDADQFLANYNAGIYPGDINADMFANLIGRAYVNGRKRKDAVVSEEENPLKEGWMVVPDASNKTGYSEEQIRRLCRDRLITSVQVGKTWVVYIPSLVEYQEGRGRGPRDDEK